MSDDLKCYILVKSHTDGMALFEFLRREGFEARVAPSPREAKSECGMSVLCDCSQLDDAISAAEKAGVNFKKTMQVQQTFDVNRHKYC